ncbi:MAG TPA: divergent polysaccharide deacetylase family protein [Alphaproteobacteria bacterium]|nr:divergent polysaccharide deacetylase family protein [Alphaproteobacteria bacterium]
MANRRPAKKKPAPATRRRKPARRSSGRAGPARPWATYLAAGAAVVFVAGLAVGGIVDWAPAPAERAAVGAPPAATPVEPPLPPRRATQASTATEAASPPAAEPTPPAGEFVTAMAAMLPPEAPKVRPSALPAALPTEPGDDAPDGPGEPAWKRHAVPADPSPGRPVIAIVIDDLGVNRKGAKDMIALPGPLTLAFMTYADDLDEQTAAARAAGHELMVHFPMEPSVAAADPGPNALLVSLEPAEIARRLDWGLARFDGYVGINNHMGSAFTEDAEAMEIVLEELDRRGLMFLDSRTTPRTAAPGIARALDLPFVQRDVFLDNEQSEAAIAAQLSILERKARDKGWAVGIGHPHPSTVAALKSWLPGLEERGFTLVPISAVVKARREPIAVSGH